MTQKRIIISAIIILSVFAMIFSSFFFTNRQKAPDFTPPQPSPQRTYPTVIIDAGHGGEDGGAVGVNGVFEKDINLAIALELDALLRSRGISTRLTRSTDTLLYDRNADFEGHKKVLDMAARLAIAEDYEDAVFVSIHMNSFGQSKYSGLQVYYSDNSPDSRVLAEQIQDLARTNLQPDNDRRIKSAKDTIFLLDRIEHPCVLIECGFLSNPEECERLCGEEYRKRLSLVICCAIFNYFDTLQNNPADIS